MNPEVLAQTVEFALKKQRLQLRAEQQRAQLMQGLERVESMLEIVDHARDGARGVGQRVPLLAAAGALLVILKPRLALRLARRAWVGWVLYRKLGRGVEPVLRILRRFVS